MRRLPLNPRSCAAAALAAAFGATVLAGRALADAPRPAVIPATGETLHYRITRSVQGLSGPQTTIVDVTLRRKSPTTLAFERTFEDRPPDLIVLAVAPDGTLEIPKNDKVSSQERALVDTVAGLNGLNEVFEGESAALPREGWNATLRLPDARGASATLVVPISVSTTAAGDADVHGVGQLSVEAQPSNGEGTASGESGRHGGHRRSGFPGGGFPGGGSPGGAEQPRGNGDEGQAAGGEYRGAGRQPLGIAVTVDGRIRHGAIAKLSILETRSISLEAEPYVNVSGWTIEAAR
jgi:uncharacterized membrane protein YgcG